MKTNYSLQRHSILLFLVFYVVIFTSHACLAYGPPDYLPNGPHPRIWLTPEELSRLNAKQNSNDPAWTALDSWCSTHIADTGYDAGLPNWGHSNAYEMSGFAMHLLNYGLAYQVLKDDNPAKAATYAARVRELLINGIAIPFSAGEELNGIVALRFHNFLSDNVSPNDRTLNPNEAVALGVASVSYKQGYSHRSLAAVPIAYDWIYETLSQPDKDILAPMLLRWFDWIRGVHGTYNNGVLINGIRYHEDKNGDCTGVNNCTSFTGSASQALDFSKMAANYNGGEMYLMSLIPVALYGYNQDVSAYLTAWKSYLSGTVLDQLESNLKHSGGDSVEGWNYGGGFIYLLPGLYGYYTATGDPLISNSAWPSSLVTAMTHRIMANYKNVPGYGYWVGATFDNRLDTVRKFAGIEQRLRPTSDASRLGQYLINNAAYAGTNTDFFSDLLWKRNDISELSLSTQPLVYLAKGNGFFTSRSSWTSPDTVHLSVRLEGKKSVDHEGYDEGNILLARGGDRLLAYKDTEAAPSVFHNTIVFNNNSHHASNPALTQPAIDRYESGSDYSYVSGDITNAWKRQWQPDRALLFRRSILHVLPGFVVTYDVTRSNSAVGNLKEWYTQYIAPPTTTLDTVSAVVGNSKAFVKTLYPLGGTFTKTNPYPGSYRVKYTPAVSQEYDQFLHVIEATASTANQTPAEKIQSIEGKMIGAYIKDAAKPTVALFNSNKNGGDVTVSNGEIISYNLPAPVSSSLQHILVQLPPNTDFTSLPTTMANGLVTYSLKTGAFTNAGKVYRSSSQGVIRLSTESSSPPAAPLTPKAVPPDPKSQIFDIPKPDK